MSVESNKKYQIPNTEYSVVKSEAYQTVYDCDGEVVSNLPADWTEHEIKIWLKAYDVGIKKGEEWGRYSGENQSQTAILKALGIYERLAELENNVKLLASILYYHEGVCKEDVAGIAGRH